MSSGAFVNAIIEDSEGGYWPCRVQPETLNCSITGAANSTAVVPGGSTAYPVSAKLSKTAKEIGFSPAFVTLAWTGAPPVGYLASENVRLPVINQVFRAACIKGATGTYLGADVEVVSRPNGESFV